MQFLPFSTPRPRAMEGHPAPAGMPRACTRLALRLEEAIKERAKANQKHSGGAVPQKSAEPVETREEIAKLGGVGKSLGTQRAVRILLLGFR